MRQCFLTSAINRDATFVGRCPVLRCVCKKLPCLDSLYLMSKSASTVSGSRDTTLRKTGDSDAFSSKSCSLAGRPEIRDHRPMHLLQRLGFGDVWISLGQDIVHMTQLDPLVDCCHRGRCSYLVFFFLSCVVGLGLALDLQRQGYEHCRRVWRTLD